MKKNNIYVSLLSALLVLCTTPGCQRKIDSDQYSSATLNSASTTYQGVILNVRKVQVSESERLQDNTAGAGLGALGGLLIGSSIGKGGGQALAMGVGAIAGGVGGAMAQEAMGKQEGFEYTIKLSNGSLRTIVQGLDVVMHVGQRVLVSIPTSSQGRPRVIPDNSGMPMEIQHEPTSSSPTIVINNR